MASFSFFSYELQLADDDSHNLTPESIPFHEINIHIYDNDVYYGNGTTIKAVAQANNTLTFKNGDLKDIFFKNKTAGNNGRIVAAGTVKHEETSKKLGL